MNCPKCGTEIPEQFKFCPECGSNVSSISHQSGVEDPVSLGGMRTAMGGSASEPTDVSLGEIKTVGRVASHDAFGSEGLGHEPLSDRYELHEEIGRGGFAVVCRATDKKLGRTVAIKKLLKDSGEVAFQTLERFKREARVIAALNHRNIVGVYDVGEDADGIYLVMEYIEGGSLREVLKEKEKLELPEALKLMRGMVQGLSHAHRNNLVHRDIKPANILLARDDQGELVPKIVDFGLARAGRESELSMSGYGMGTPWYMPPEQRRDAKNVNHTADIYALGKVLYEMVSGEIPDTLDPSEIPPPPALAGIIFKCTKPKSADRYFSVDDLLQDLEGIGLAATERKGVPRLIEEGNECPVCERANPAGAKFCEGCGGGLFRNCPECDLENSVNKQFCGACGTEVEGFLAAQEIFRRMEAYAAEQKWSRVVKEANGFNAETRLPGERGAMLRMAIAESLEKTQQALKEIERLEKGVVEAAASHSDKKLLNLLAGLSKLKPLSEDFQALEKETQARVAEVARIEAERVAKAKAEVAVVRKKRALKTFGIAAALVAAVFAADQAMLALRKGAFNKAIAHKQPDKAYAVAQKLGERYATADDLVLLEEALKARAGFEQTVKGQSETLAKFGGKEWRQVEALVAEAEAPGSPAVAIENYPIAKTIVVGIRSQIEPLLAAEGAFSKDWNSKKELVKQYAPVEFEVLSAEREKARATTNPNAGTKAYRALSSSLGSAAKRADAEQAKEKAMLAAKQKWTLALAAIHGRGADAEAVATVEQLETYAPSEWAAVQQLVGQAAEDEKPTRFDAAEAGYEKAVVELEKTEKLASQLNRQADYDSALDEAEKAEQVLDWNTAYAAYARALNLGLADPHEAVERKGKLDLRLKSATGARSNYDAALANTENDLLENFGETEWVEIQRIAEKGAAAKEPHQKTEYYNQAASQLTGLAYLLYYRAAKDADLRGDSKDVRHLARRALSIKQTLEAGTLLARYPEPREGQGWKVDLGPGVIMDFMPIAPGSFQMGSKNGGSDEKPVHAVELTKPFWLAKTEVTQAQYQKIMGANPSSLKDPEKPVEQVSWSDAMDFCEKLTQHEQKSGCLPEEFEYTLPTEAQWEYACRAGTAGDHAGNLKKMGWHGKNSGGETHPVGTKRPNAWGLCDMHGNVWEWCLDWHGDYPEGSVVDPKGVPDGSHKVPRGGSMNNSASYCRSARRIDFLPGRTDYSLGFRPLVQRR